jgi:hypothetical protein
MPLPSIPLNGQTARTIVLGIVSLALYVLLFSNEDLVLRMSTGGGWYTVVPIVIAFVFSFVHGAFTGGFWEMLGLRAKVRKEPKRWSN